MIAATQAAGVSQLRAPFGTRGTVSVRSPEGRVAFVSYMATKADTGAGGPWIHWLDCA